MCSYFQHTVNIYSSNIDWNVTYSAGEPGFPMKCAKPKAVGGGGANLLSGQNFPENFMKMKKKLDRESSVDASKFYYVDPPLLL